MTLGAHRTRATESKSVREHRFDYKKSKPNHYAKRMGRNVIVVVLDSDVAAVFHDSKRVNAALRATIKAKQKRRPRKAG
jgi:hypothetical protein